MYIMEDLRIQTKFTMLQEKRPQSGVNLDNLAANGEAGCLYALITDKRSVSRRNRTAWYLSLLNKLVKPNPTYNFDDVEPPPDTKAADSTGIATNEEPNHTGTLRTDINLISLTASPTSNAIHNVNAINRINHHNQQQYLVTPSTRVVFLSKSIATSIALDLSPSVVSVSSQNGCVFLDSMFDALKRVLHLLVKAHEIPSSLDATETFILTPKVYISVIAYTPYVVAKNNQILVQNRRISMHNIDQVLVEVWLSLNKLSQEIHELVGNTYGSSTDFDLLTSKNSTGNVFVFPQATNYAVMRPPGSVLEDIFELGLFSSSLMPRLSRLSIIVISDGLFTSTNNLNIFRLKSIAVSFVCLSAENTNPDACFGYTPYVDLMRFTSKTTLGVYLTHQELSNLSQNIFKNKCVNLLSNPLYKLLCWTIHSERTEDQLCYTPKATNYQSFEPTDEVEVSSEHVARFFCVDQPIDTLLRSSDGEEAKSNVNATSHNYHDWRSFKQLDRSLDADFEQVLSCLLREGYLIKSIQFKHKETSKIIARLILHWRHNLDIEQELTAPYWSSTDPFDLGVDNNQLIQLRPFNAPLYGDTYCEVIVHGSYSFLHNLYCDGRVKRKSEYRYVAYRQFRQLIDSVLQTHERLQYMSRFYRDSSLSKVPSFLQHGNSLLYEQPHTHKLTSTIENVLDESKTNEFQDYWQKISCLETRSWKNLMHIHTLRLVLEHDQPKHKNIHCQNANGRYTHVQCRRALSAISTFIKSYASFALLEDTTYIKFIYNRDDDLREIETSATKGFIVIRINKLLPIVVVYLMFTSGILDSHRVQIVAYLEDQLTKCKLRNVRTSNPQAIDNILKSKTIAPSSESCCVLIKSPLERMLKVYSRNFVSDFLIHNWSHGLPGSCPYSIHQQQQQQQQQNIKGINAESNGSGVAAATTHQQIKPRSELMMRDQLEGYYNPESSISRFNLVFGKYLYGVRVVHTITNLPHDIVPSLASNVLSKISAILVNVRIKQGFHIAFNNSGILNLVVELAMKDYSNEDKASSCLCQYIVFPPTVTNCASHHHHHQSSVLIGSHHNVGNASSGLGNGSKSGSLTGSLGNSESFMNNKVNNTQQQDSTHSSSHLRSDTGEIKIVKEYWIEQQYGVSSKSDGYHKSLKDMRYSEIVDHLYLTDLAIFECLLTYDLLQLWCDKLSLYHDLDSSFVKDSPPLNQAQSPAISANSSSQLNDGQVHYTSGQSLPSSLIEGSSKDANSKGPLIELEYKFSISKFLDYCQQASLNVLLFRDQSEFHEPFIEDYEFCTTFSGNQKTKDPPLNDHSSFATNHHHHHDEKSTPSVSIGGHQRKMSMNISDSDIEHTKREHRSSYQLDNNVHNSSYVYMNPIYSPSLNHLFLETLHKRLKQIHDKELKLSLNDRKKLPMYLKRRIMLSEQEEQQQVHLDSEDSVFDDNIYNSARVLLSPLLTHDETSDLDDGDDDDVSSKSNGYCSDEDLIEWRCFLRKGNQENLMIVLIPATLSDVTKWLNFINQPEANKMTESGSPSKQAKYDPVCPIFVFRCSSTMINDHLLSFLRCDDKFPVKSILECDLSLHFGQPCTYMGQLKPYNDEINNEILPLNRESVLNQTNSDEKTLEVVHFRAFLRKIKNTVLKSRFSSLNDAYLSELFIHKDDILYYINNVDMDTQKKYHVSAQLRSLAEFVKGYEEFNDSLPTEPGKPYNKLLNSILLQKCGLFINQPIARFDESNPLMKQLHDKKLLFLMRCNYKIELPILEENLASSTLLKSFVKSSPAFNSSSSALVSSSSGHHHYSISVNAAPSALSRSIASESILSNSNLATTSSLGKTAEGSRLMEMKCGSSVGGGITGAGSPSTSFTERHKLLHHHQYHHYQRQAPRLGSSSTNVSSSLPSSANDSFILEAFKGSKSCSIKEVPIETENDISLRHEAHMAEVLRRTGERKESHHYRRVLKSKGNYNQSHGAIDQALKRVDSLGRLEHFCLTPLLFSPSWRSKLAPVRDHTIESIRPARLDPFDTTYHHLNDVLLQANDSTATQNNNYDQQTAQQEADERWHQLVCNNYIKEYEQYIQTLGFNSVQIKYQSATTKASATANQNSPSSATTGAASSYGTKKTSVSSASGAGGAHSSTIKQQQNSSSGAPLQLRKGSLSTSTASLLAVSNASTYNTGYLIKFLNSGCLVFKVGFCKPYVYSILYSIEGERFNNSNMKLNMTAFLDELDNIKVTMHLHSFTYDYHLRSMYSYISGRQLTFSHGYHLISFLDDFRKYYQKAPNYARNHILCGEVTISNIKVNGQQLYNYIVMHNKVYNMDVLEMSSFASSLSNNKDGIAESSENSMKDLKQLENALKNHSLTNDYVLIELKREKVRYRDGKDPDVFDCGLLITFDSNNNSNNSSSSTIQQANKNSITLKYFFLLTNQRDLYPKLIHTYDNIISGLGCHRPIRLGVAQQLKQPVPAAATVATSAQPAHHKTAPSSGQSDLEDVQSSELQSSGEVSGPTSIISTANSIQSSTSGLQFGFSGSDKGGQQQASDKTSLKTQKSAAATAATNYQQQSQPTVKIEIDEASAVWKSSLESSSINIQMNNVNHLPVVSADAAARDAQSLQDSSIEEGSVLGLTGVESANSLSSSAVAATAKQQQQQRQRTISTGSSSNQKNLITSMNGQNVQERTICDEEITYLGYFSSDEMDMLKFLQEKTTSLREHIEEVVQIAEVHYRRDYLWQKLMLQQRTTNSSSNKSSSTSSDEIPLTVDELSQLLSIVESIDLATLDPQLSTFTGQHINWYLKLFKAFQDLKQSSINQHEIYTLKIGNNNNKHLVLYIDPKCSAAFILLTIDIERGGSIELNMLLKDRNECVKSSSSSQSEKIASNLKNATTADDQQQQQSISFELDQDCHQLINDFVNFYATFMWSTLLA